MSLLDSYAGLVVSCMRVRFSRQGEWFSFLGLFVALGWVAYQDLCS